MMNSNHCTSLKLSTKSLLINGFRQLIRTMFNSMNALCVRFGKGANMRGKKGGTNVVKVTALIFHHLLRT